ncbi:radical SAM family heme chaperone HemW [Petroclostridium sp. X23]|uniref:radical SAM family heme chaperone HemW n=1 Tax=Petroclostridium sp. X23 TaxID=3045146 RepID=UPI0024ACE30F|nr:radical SAM family heme chaperone HemW [Petroclostridium sp. X23]WHH60430.1 radical SAM family heme chaperone HemW [Petroclostridium sp. X23]
MKMTGLYIHIPFCVQKCYYCDFNSYAGISHMQEEYIEGLIKEMQLYKEKMNATALETIFIGGGTPTCLAPKLLEKMLKSCYELFHIKDGCEISIESNPGTLSREKLRVLKQYGVNRLSIGLQSWDDEQLKTLGRIHSKEIFKENYYTAREEGFNNINVDLMFSLPKQKLEHWHTTLENVINLAPEHASCYALKIEEGTNFYRDYENDILQLPDEESDRQMYHMAIEMLEANEYHHYEISNFAKKDLECRHNLLYWEAKEYIGVGAGAHSYIDEVRYSNVLSPQEYLKKINMMQLPNEEENRLTVEDRMSEYMFLGLRLMKGVDSREFYHRFGVALEDVYGKPLEKFINMGMVEKNQDIFKLTKRGIDVSNQIFIEFI